MPAVGVFATFANNICDAHVEGIVKPIDANLFKALLTRNRREPILPR